MTKQEAISKLVAWASAQVGYAEGANNWNKYAPEWTQAGGWNAQNQPWCDVFVDVAFIECFGLDLASKLTYQPKGGFSALCSASANYYKAHNAWFSTPEVGDQVFFYADGGINHTGIVVEVSGGIVYTVEGNTSDMVARRAYAIGSPVIAGFGRPKWDAVTDDSASDPAPSKPTAPSTPAVKVSGLPVLQRGNKGEVVRAAQFLLNGRGASCGIYGADADFGAATEAAVLAFQRRNSLEADGVIGEQTWSKLLGL